MTTIPINPGCIRVQAALGDMSGACDYEVERLPDWFESMETSAEPQIVRGSDNGAQMVGGMAFYAARQGNWDLACMAALWIVIYGPGVRDTTLYDFVKLADCGVVVTITANADGSSWHMQTSILDPVLH